MANFISKFLSRTPPEYGTNNGFDLAFGGGVTFSEFDSALALRSGILDNCYRWLANQIGQTVPKLRNANGDIRDKDPFLDVLKHPSANVDLVGNRYQTLRGVGTYGGG